MTMTMSAGMKYDIKNTFIEVRGPRVPPLRRLNSCPGRAVTPPFQEEDGYASTCASPRCTNCAEELDALRSEVALLRKRVASQPKLRRRNRVQWLESHPLAVESPITRDSVDATKGLNWNWREETDSEEEPEAPHGDRHLSWETKMEPELEEGEILEGNVEEELFAESIEKVEQQEQASLVKPVQTVDVISEAQKLWAESSDEEEEVEGPIARAVATLADAIVEAQRMEGRTDSFSSIQDKEAEDKATEDVVEGPVVREVATLADAIWEALRMEGRTDSVSSRQEDVVEKPLSPPSPVPASQPATPFQAEDATNLGKALCDALEPFAEIAEEEESPVAEPTAPVVEQRKAWADVSDDDETPAGDHCWVTDVAPRAVFSSPAPVQVKPKKTWADMSKDNDTPVAKETDEAPRTVFASSKPVPRNPWSQAAQAERAAAARAKKEEPKKAAWTGTKEWATVARNKPSENQPFVRTVRPEAPWKSAAKKFEKKPARIERKERKLYVEIRDDKDFLVVRRIIGKGGENIKSISQNAPGAHIQIRGEGTEHSSSDELHLFLTAPEESIEQATNLCNELLDNIENQYRQFMARR